MMQTLTSRFSFVFVAKVLSLLLSIAISPLLVRALGAESYGSYVFLFSLFGLYMILISTGVTDGVQKYLGERREAADWDERVLGFYLKYGLVLALVGGAAVWIVGESGVVSRFLDGEQLGLYFRLLAVLTIATQLRSYTQRALLGFELEKYNSIFRVLYKLGFLGGAIGLVSLGYGVAGVMVAHIAMSSLIVLLGLGVIATRVSLTDVFLSSTSGLPRREMLVFNNMSIALILLLTTLYHVDVILLRYFEGKTVTAQYKIALVFAEFLWFVPLALQTILVQSAAQLFERDEYAQIERVSARITRYTVLITALMALGIAGLAPVVIPLLYTPEFLVSVNPLLVLLPGALGFAVARPILAIGQGSGQLRLMVAMAGVVALLNLILNLVLIPQHGMMGAALATSVSYGLIPLLYTWSARQIGFDPFAELRPARLVTTIALAAVPILWLSRTISPDFIALVVVPPVGLLLYSVIAIATGAIDIGEIAEFLRSLPGPFGDWAAASIRRLSGTTFARIVT